MIDNLILRKLRRSSMKTAHSECFVGTSTPTPSATKRTPVLPVPAPKTRESPPAALPPPPQTGRTCPDHESCLLSCEALASATAPADRRAFLPRFRPLMAWLTDDGGPPLWSIPPPKARQDETRQDETRTRRAGLTTGSNKGWMMPTTVTAVRLARGGRGPVRQSPTSHGEETVRSYWTVTTHRMPLPMRKAAKILHSASSHSIIM